MNKNSRITDQLLDAYMALHWVLDSNEPLTDQQAQRLSRASSAIAVAYHEATGEKIGVALGWA